jgi:hypothetical protein
MLEEEIGGTIQKVAGFRASLRKRAVCLKSMSNACGRCGRSYRAIGKRLQQACNAVDERVPQSAEIFRIDRHRRNARMKVRLRIHCRSPRSGLAGRRLRDRATAPPAYRNFTRRRRRGSTGISVPTIWLRARCRDRSTELFLSCDVAEHVGVDVEADVGHVVNVLAGDEPDNLADGALGVMFCETREGF